MEQLAELFQNVAEAVKSNVRQVMLPAELGQVAFGKNNIRIPSRTLVRVSVTNIDGASGMAAEGKQMGRLAIATPGT